MPSTALDCHAAAPAALAGLRGIALLQGLPEDVLAEVAQASRFQLVRARQAVMSRADQGQDCCFILSGRLRVVALSLGGREVSFRDAGAGETIGELAALDGRPRSATVVALQESLLARIGAGHFKALLAHHWVICERLLQHLARTARLLTERVYELSTLNVHERLCAELLRLALGGRQVDGQPRDGALRVVLVPPPVHGELAMRISCTREQVAREMGELARLGLVRRLRDADAQASVPPTMLPLERGREALVIEDLRRLAERIEAPPLRA